MTDTAPAAPASSPPASSPPASSPPASSPSASSLLERGKVGASTTAHAVAGRLPSTGAKRTVMLGIGGATLIAAIGQAAQEGSFPSARIPVGGFIAAILLAGLAEAWPDAAAALAILALVSAATVYGGPTWSALSRLFK